MLYSGHTEDTVSPAFCSVDGKYAKELGISLAYPTRGQFNETALHSNCSMTAAVPRTWNRSEKS